MLTKIEISHRTIIFIVAFLAGIWLFLQVLDIVYLLFIAFILMTALGPFVELLERLRVPRLFGIIISYLVIFGFFSVSVAGALPSLISQTQHLIKLVPAVVERLLPYWNIDAGQLTQQLAPIGENVFKVTIGIFSNLVTLFTVLIFTFYFLLERQKAPKYINSLVGEAGSSKVLLLLHDIENRIGAWVRGQVTLMVLVGLAVYIGLTLLRVDYALPLAILAAFMEIVPMIGPLVSGVVAVLVALATSPLLGVSVAALYFVIQQIENSVIVPFVMHKSVGLSPLITILSLLVGGRLAGVLGAVLAVPTFLVLQALLMFVLTQNSETKLRERS